VGSNKSFQPTKPLVTALAVARPAPNAFAAEADVIRSREKILNNICWESRLASGLDA